MDKKFLLEHLGHKLTVVIYGPKKNPHDVCIECEDCNEVIYSWETYHEEEEEECE